MPDPFAANAKEEDNVSGPCSDSRDEPLEESKDEANSFLARVEDQEVRQAGQPYNKTEGVDKNAAGSPGQPCRG